MTAREMGMSVGLNIAATSVGWYIKGPTGAIIVGCAGIAITAITHFLTRKTSSVQLPPSPSSPRQEVKQEANPHINISIGNSSSNATTAAPAPAA